VYTCIELNRLNWIRQNQGKLRTGLYSGLQDVLDQGDRNAEQVGKRIFLPSSHTGSPRYMQQNLQDAMAICHWIGYPNLFITFTCNTKWSEIQYMIDKSIVKQKTAKRAAIIIRVFIIKLKELLQDIVKGKRIGETLARGYKELIVSYILVDIIIFTYGLNILFIYAVVYKIEFQKIGLRHAHILTFLNDRNLSHDPSVVDKFISAKILDKELDPKGYTTVENYMIHGPCGELNRNSVCMEGNKCTKHFSKGFNSETTIDEEGFLVYRR
jgi:hypothetical protein